MITETEEKQQEVLDMDEGVETTPLADTGEEKPEAPVPGDEGEGEEKALADVAEGKEEPGGKRAKKRIHQLLDERHVLRQRIAELESGGQTAQPPTGQAGTSAVPNGRPKKPNPKEFGDELGDINWDKYNEADEKYVENLITWNARQQELTVAKQAVDRTLNEMKQEFTQKTRNTAKTYADYDDTVREYEPLQPVWEFIMDSSVGPELAYHLAKNPNVNQEIETLALKSPTQMHRALIALENKFKLPGRKPATPPINPVSGASGVLTKDPGKMTAEEYYHARQAGLIS